MPNSLARLRETAYKIPRGSAEIRLTCGHRALYLRPLPVPGADAYCRDCRTWRRRKRDARERGQGNSNKSTPGGGGNLAPPNRRRDR